MLGGLCVALAAVGLLAVRDLAGVGPGPARTRPEAPASEAGRDRSAASALEAPDSRGHPSGAARPRVVVDVRVLDERDRPVPQAVVDVLSASGRTYEPPATGVTDAHGVVRLSFPDAGESHRVEVRPQVLLTPADGGAQVVPWARVGPWLASQAEESVRGWYPTRVASWRAPWAVLRVRSWVRARVTVRSEAVGAGTPAVPAPGVFVAVRLEDDDPDRFLRVTTTDVEGHAAFWLWRPDPVDVIALASGPDLHSGEASLTPDDPEAEMLLRGGWGGWDGWGD